MRAWVFLLSIVGSMRWASSGPRVGRPEVLALGDVGSSRLASSWGPHTGRSGVLPPLLFSHRGWWAMPAALLWRWAARRT